MRDFLHSAGRRNGCINDFMIEVQRKSGSVGPETKPHAGRHFTFQPQVGIVIEIEVVVIKPPGFDGAVKILQGYGSLPAYARIGGLNQHSFISMKIDNPIKVMAIR